MLGVEELPLEEGESVLVEMDRDAGDRRIKWKRDDPASVAKAKARFEALRSKGYGFIRVASKALAKIDPAPGESVVVVKRTRDNRPEGTSMREFDPEAERVVAIPQRRGG